MECFDGNFNRMYLHVRFFIGCAYYTHVRIALLVTIGSKAKSTSVPFV